jgi:hypothetical protein
LGGSSRRRLQQHGGGSACRGGRGLSVPPPLYAVAGDDGTVTAARFGRDGTYLAYLNATPLQGGEHLQGWAGFRLEHLRDDDARSAVEVSSASMLHFRGGTGSCIIDDYVADVGAHRFREIACLVEGGNTGSVVVAATPLSEWARFAPLLDRAIASYSAD